MAYDETAVQVALTRTMALPEAQEVVDTTETLDGKVVISREDLVALRDVALARRDNEGQAIMSLTLEALNTKVAVYGPGDEQMRISRTAYEALGRPPRLGLRLDGEKS